MLNCPAAAPPVRTKGRMMAPRRNACFTWTAGERSEIQEGDREPKKIHVVDFHALDANVCIRVYIYIHIYIYIDLDTYRVELVHPWKVTVRSCKMKVGSWKTIPSALQALHLFGGKALILDHSKHIAKVPESLIQCGLFMFIAFIYYVIIVFFMVKDTFWGMVSLLFSSGFVECFPVETVCIKLTWPMFVILVFVTNNSGVHLKFPFTRVSLRCW